MYNKEMPLILVTGAGHRLGFEIARACLMAGYRVVAHYHQNMHELQAWLKENSSFHDKVILCQADLTNDLAPIEKILTRYQNELFGLVHSASMFVAGDLEDVPAFEAQLVLNTIVPLRLTSLWCQYASQGSVVTIIDGNIHRLNRTYQSYRISKLFLQELTRQMAYTYGPAIRVNGVAPGTVIPPVGDEQSSFERAKAMAPLEKMPRVASVTSVICMLLENEDITGEVIAVDGGMHIL